jgi:hypothetical protein
MRKPLIISLIVLGLLAILFVPAKAFEMNDDGVISADQVINDDLFIEAEKVVINGTVNGNLFVNASEVSINGPVNGNLLIFGAVAKVNAPVNGSVAFVGQSLELNNRVEGSVFAAGALVVVNPQAVIGLNLYFAGYSAQTMPGSKIGVDVSLACSQAILQGEITRDLHAGLSALELDGTVGGDAQVEVEQPNQAGFSLRFMKPDSTVQLPDAIPSGIRVSETAKVGGMLKYTSPVEQASTIALLTEQVAYEAPVVTKKLTPAEDFQKRVLGAARDWITLLIFGLLMLHLLQRPFQRSSAATRRWLPALGWGMVVFVVVPMAVLLLGAAIVVISLLLGVVTLSGLSALVSVGGSLSLTLLALAFLVILFHISKLVVAASVGGWLVQRIWPQRTVNPIWPLIIGISLYVLITLLPFGVGALFSIVVTLIGLGALWIAYRQRNLLPETLTPNSPDHSGELSEVA